MGILVYILFLFIGVTLYFCAVSYGCIYTCPKCGEKFTVNVKNLFLTMHFFTEHYVKCPKCEMRSFIKGKKEIVK